MKKYWYTLLLAFSLLISAIISTLPASVYGIVTSVFVRVCSNGQEMIENDIVDSLKESEQNVSFQGHIF